MQEIELILVNPGRHSHENVPITLRQVDEISSHRFSSHSLMSVKSRISQYIYDYILFQVLEINFDRVQSNVQVSSQLKVKVTSST